MVMPTTVRGSAARPRWRRWGLCVSLTIGVVAVPSPSGAGAPDDGGLVIIDAGDPTNRADLLPSPVAGATAEVVSAETFASSAVDDATGEVVGEFTATLDSQQTLVVLEVQADGEFVARSRVDSAEVEGAAELILGLDFRELVGMGWDSVVGPDGVVIRSDLVDSGRLTETALSLRAGLPTPLMALVPMEPVGQGARWTIELEDFSGTYSYDCRLVSVAGDRFRVEFDYRFDTTSLQDGTRARVVTEGHGDYDGSLARRLDSTYRVADRTTVTTEGGSGGALTDDLTVVTEYTAATVSRPIGG